MAPEDRVTWPVAGEQRIADRVGEAKDGRRIADPKNRREHGGGWRQLEEERPRDRQSRGSHRGYNISFSAGGGKGGEDKDQGSMTSQTESTADLMSVKTEICARWGFFFGHTRAALEGFMK